MQIQSPYKSTTVIINDEQFIDWVQLIWDENETDNNDANLERPFDVHTAMIYLINYTEFEIASVQ